MNAPLPKPIQRQIEAANAAQAAMAQQAQGGEAVLTDPTQLAAPAADPQASVPPVDNAAPSAPPAPQAADKEWEQKFKSMQGRYQAQLAETLAQNKALESNLAQMQQQIDALAAAAKANEQKAKPAADPKDVENFGADLIEMVQRYAERVFQSMSDQFGQAATQLDKRVSALEQQVTGVQSRTEATLEQQFYAALAGAVPDWEQINVNPRWLEWLGEVDPVYGVQRQVALDRAREDLDVKRVANVFNAFKQAHPARTQPSLSNQVAPSSVSAPAPEAAPAAKPILSSKFVEKFYNDKAKGRYAGREDEAERIEAEINAAARDGRIR